MIIAELSANHAHDEKRAHDWIDSAANAGADAIKVQTYTPDTLTFHSIEPPFVVRDQALWKGRSLWDLYQEAHTPWHWQPALKAHAEELGLQFIASVFDFSSVEFWQQHDLRTYKIASPELIDLPLLKAVAQTERPIILSTGMATLDEIDEAVMTLQRANPSMDLTLLKCSSSYPAPVESMNLAGIQTLLHRYELTVGLSDHSLEHAIAVAAVGLGATVFEKHMKLPDGPPSPDDAFSLTPDAFHQWATQIRTALQAIGSGELKPSESEQATLPFRRSLFVVEDMQPGDPFTAQNLRSIRPADGMHPRHYESVLSKQAACAISAGTPLHADLITAY